MAAAKTGLALLIGQCLPCNVAGFARVQVTTLKLNQVIHAYYADKQVYMAYNDDQIGCKPGDTVLIEQLPQSQSAVPPEPATAPPSSLNMSPATKPRGWPPAWGYDGRPRLVPKLVSTGVTSHQLHDVTQFRVQRVVYQYGDTVDPLTNLSTMGIKYRHLVQLESDLAGKDGGVRFEYETAPARGWQEGRRDWSHLEPELKEHDDGERKPHQW